MGLFSFFRKRAATAVDIQKKAPDATVIEESNLPTVFRDPLLLATWVKVHFLDRIPLANDYELLPDEAARQDLAIDAEQCARCLREYSVLRIAGTSLHVKLVHDDVFWLRYTDKVAEYLLEHIATQQFKTTYFETRTALEEYVLAAVGESEQKAAVLYMRRVYDDNPNYLRMKIAGVGSIADRMVSDAHEILRDADCQVRYGRSYDELVVSILETGPSGNGTHSARKARAPFSPPRRSRKTTC